MTGESTMKAARQTALLIAIVFVVGTAACGGKKPPGRPPDASAAADLEHEPVAPAGPPEPVAEPTIVPPEPVRDAAISSASLDELNKNSPLKPVFYELDSSELSAAVAEDARGERRADEALSQLDRHRRRPLR
jgi:predicted small lipoprotein YifL